MAALECNNGQEGFSPTENGDTLPEEKPLNIDYSEDLWLANEDSSGPYGHQPNKVVSHDTCHGSHDVTTELPDGFSNPSTHCQELDSHSMDTNTHGLDTNTHTSDTTTPHVIDTTTHTIESIDPTNSEFSQTASMDVHRQAWNEVITDGDSGNATPIQPTTGYVNGSLDHNGMEFSSSGDEKDFAQLVPAGSYVETAGNGGVENQDKTFTSLMPAAAMGANGEIEPTFTTMLNANQQQMVFYGSGDQLTSQSSPIDLEAQEKRVFQETSQIAAVKEESGEGATEEGNGTLFVPMENLNSDSQATDGNFTVLSPAMINMSNVSTDGQSYPPCVSGFHNISTLPFVQNGVYPSHSSFSSPYQHPGNTTIVSNDEDQQQQQQVLQQSDYSSDQTSFTSEANTLPGNLQQGAIDYQEDDQDEDTNNEGEDNSGEFSEFCCPVCSEVFPDQTALDDHVNNHPPLKTFVCETCGKGFATRRYLKYHRKNHCKRAGSYEGRNDLDENDPNGEVKRFSCNICSRPFRVLKCMKVHKKKKHGILKEFTCQNCAITYNSSQELIDHACQPKSGSSTPQVIQYTPPPLALPSQRKKRKLKQVKPSCDICGKTFSDRISVDIHRVKHIEEELYPCDMCSQDQDGTQHLAVHFRIRFFTDDNQHILEDQKAAVATQDMRSDDGSSLSVTPIHNPGTPIPGSAPATPVYLPATPNHAPGMPGIAHQSENGVSTQIMEQPSGTVMGQASGTGQVVDQSGFAQEYVKFAVGQVEEESEAMSVSNYVVTSNETLLLTNQNLIVNQQQAEGVRQRNLAQQQQIYNTNFEEGEVIHDASGSIMAVTPKKKKFKRSKIHMCDICNKSFGDTAKLELHYKSNHLHDRPYQCDVCEKSFFTKWKLQRHMLSHLEQKPHSCPMCSKSFVERGKLEAHYRTHLGTKPYKCDQCPKAFTVKSQLSIHQRRIHSTDQPFGCLVCGKAFLWKSGLDKHMRKHTREKPYICETCGMKYSNKANLIVHMSKAHNQTYVDQLNQ